MSKLLIHIGCHKTATSTFQEKVFYQMHHQDMINYLGRVSFADNINNPYLAIHNYLNSNKPLEHKFSDFLSNDKLNVLSSEELCAIKQAPQKLASILETEKENSDIKILLVMRSHKTRVHSMFVQIYHHFDKKYNLDNTLMGKDLSTFSKIKNFDDYLDFVYQNREENLFGFYLDETLKEYKKYFGKENIKILLFEDLIHNRDFFLQQVSDIMEFDNNIITEIVGEKHENQKVKTQEGVYAEIHHRPAYIVIQKIMNSSQIISKSARFLYHKTFLKTLMDKIMNLGQKNCKHLIPKQTQEQTDSIFAEFKAVNLAIAQEFNLDKEKMEKYGYF